MTIRPDRPAQARAEFDPLRFGVRIAVSPRSGQVLVWDQPNARTYDPDAATAPTEDEWLHIEEDTARAIYEELAVFFGHAAHDVRSLRKDYDAERGRVDRLIKHLTGGAS